MKLRLIPWFSLGTAGVLAVGLAAGSFSMKALAQDADETRAEESTDEGDDADKDKDKDKDREERPQRDQGPGLERRMEARMRAIKELREQIEDAQQELSKLRNDGEDTSEAEAHLKELYEKMTNLQREFGGTGVGPGGPGNFRPDQQREEMVKRMKSRLEELDAEIKKAEESGDKDKLRGLRREANATKRRLEAMSGEGPRRSDAFAPGAPNAEAQKLMHLRMAAQHLRAAGLEEQADAIGKQADELQEKLGEEGDFAGGPGTGGFIAPPLGNFPGGGVPGGPGAGSYGPPGGDPTGGVREEVNQLRNEIEALRRELRKALGREGDERRDGDDSSR